MSKTRLIKRLSAAVIAAGLTVIPAWTALAVTNPADNPNPITVTGDDGNTYHDGADTLPGYDDEECTYIPGAYFDFANNRVRYADGQSIHWTEWSRASGYTEWLASQNSVSTPGEDAPNTSSGSSKTGNQNAGSNVDKTNESTTESVSSEELTPVASEVTQFTAGSPASNLSNPGRETGIIILSALFLTGVLTFLVSAARNKLSGGNR